MQDELTLVRQELRNLRQQRLQEGAKQQPNEKLLYIMDANFRQLAASEERLMESMPSGSRHTLQVSSLSSQPVSQWLRSVSVEAWKSSVGALEPACPGTVNLMSSLQCAVSAKT